VVAAAVAVVDRFHRGGQAVYSGLVRVPLYIIIL